MDARGLESACKGLLGVLCAGLAGLACVALTVCLPGNDPAQGKSDMIKGTPDSKVLKLRPGRSADRVSQMIGAHQNEDFNASDGGTSCRSFEYDETFVGKYVHAYFYYRVLTAASDGHSGLCAFGGDVN